MFSKIFSQPNFSSFSRTNASANKEGEINFFEILSFLNKFKIIIIISTIFSVLIGFIYTSTNQKFYKSLFYVEADLSKIPESNLTHLSDNLARMHNILISKNKTYSLGKDFLIKTNNKHMLSLDNKNQTSINISCPTSTSNCIIETIFNFKLNNYAQLINYLNQSFDIYNKSQLNLILNEIKWDYSNLIQDNKEINYKNLVLDTRKIDFLNALKETKSYMRLIEKYGLDKNSYFLNGIETLHLQNNGYLDKVNQNYIKSLIYLLIKNKITQSQFDKEINNSLNSILQKEEFSINILNFNNLLKNNLLPTFILEKEKVINNSSLNHNITNINNTKFIIIFGILGFILTMFLCCAVSLYSKKL